MQLIKAELENKSSDSPDETSDVSPLTSNVSRLTSSDPRLTSNVSRLTYVALAALFVPTFHKLFTYGWKNADYSHGPLILAAFFWLLWRNRDFMQGEADERFHFCSFGLLLFGLFCYTVGSIFSSMVTESFAVIPVFVGVTGLLFGKRGVKRVLFPAGFLAFLVPPPSFVIDMITGPLQLLVTKASAFLLKSAGYLITREGVIIHIADYTIIVGEVCSGLRSLISLMAVGAIYAYLQNITNLKRSKLFLSIIPISIIANIFRLITLSLITYYFGEAAGQGFFHNFSGFVLFAVAMVCLVIVDVVMERMTKPLAVGS